MVWTIKYSDKAQKQLKKLDRTIARRIHDFLHQRVITHGNPRCLGRALIGKEWGEFWRYRVGDYRIVAKIDDKNIQVFVVGVGNRDAIYTIH